MIEHWLPVGAGVFLIGMMLYGHYRGLLRQCVSVGALLLTFLLVRVATPYVTEYLSENSWIKDRAAGVIMDAVGWNEPSPEESTVPSIQRIVIEELKLPQSVKDSLLENNNHEYYDLLGVSQFGEYVSSYLANELINTVVSATVFVVCYFLIQVTVRWLDLLSRLPIIHGLNHIAGAVLGLAQGLLILWVAALLLSIFSATPTGQILKEEVYTSRWLTILYENNPIGIFL